LEKGGLGPVYYGKLENGKKVAIKVLDVKSSQGHLNSLIKLMPRKSCFNCN
jgi:exosome complex RNA-binding protein Rrp4